jgi:glycosyltransferase involved in cell wall biosynthesis
MMPRRLRVALIASARFPISEPFAGGLEAHTWALADGLQRRGHEVSLFAAPGSDARLPVRFLELAELEVSAQARSDVSMPSPAWLAEHHAYLDLMLRLAEDGHREYDVVHNNSLHHLPLAMARTLTVPVVTTLHTPPTPWLESAISLGPCPVTFVTVSEHTASAWRHLVLRPHVIRNGIDLARWQPGPGGGPLVWFGRLVPEKGPDLAARAARAAGVALHLVGPRCDPAFFDAEVAPLLGDGVEYVGHLRHAELQAVVGRAGASVISPRWDEPYGLVAAESLGCGTPVIAFARGGLPEVVDESSGVLVPPDDVAALAAAMRSFGGRDRALVRRRAERACSLARLVHDNEQFFFPLAHRAAA